MMEKAYADFTQSHGKDGQGLSKAEKKLGSGYKVINTGGAVEDCYQLFYGDSATTGTQATTFTPGGNIVTSNIAALQKLLTYSAQQGNTAAGSTQTFMHARIGSDGACKRGDALIDFCKGLLFGEQLLDDVNGAIFSRDIREKIDALLRKINRQLLSTSLTTLQTTIKAKIAGTKKDGDVAKATEPVITPDLFPHLWDNSLPAQFGELRDNLGILVNLGDDSGNKQRTNYAGHAYEVRGVQMADNAGAALALTAADLPAKAASIDPLKSQVLMHNPHATNEPDMRGTGPADAKDDGKFSYTLDQFLRNFDLLRFADVAH
jgi:hypothetical protein